MFFDLTTVIVGLLTIINGVVALGPPAVNLRTAGGFTILGETGISTVPPSAITGNIGVSPIGAPGLTGFSLVLDSSGTFSRSTQIVGEAFAASYVSPTPSQLTTAILDLGTAFNDANGRVGPNFTNLASGLIGGLTLAPGLYKWTTSVNAATSFTISGGPLDTWIFQIAGNLGLATAVRVILAGGALHSNIVWVVAGTVTVNPTAHLEGVVLGKTSITIQTSGSVNGRLLAQTNVALQEATVTA